MKDSSRSEDITSNYVIFDILQDVINDAVNETTSKDDRVEPICNKDASNQSQTDKLEQPSTSNDTPDYLEIIFDSNLHPFPLPPLPEEEAQTGEENIKTVYDVLPDCWFREWPDVKPSINWNPLNLRNKTICILISIAVLSICLGIIFITYFAILPNSIKGMYISRTAVTKTQYQPMVRFSQTTRS